ncbi:hypothetical protein SLS60_005878 [Paraconiothyrium brasiliense]|uniref:Uncharacterized protein n=1 Tax=Paraconiothyrium brasiliense TaxID=300254 RepID=A0ABR3RDL2_9PLEO
MVSQNLARNIWINAVEREDSAKEDLLAKVLVLDKPRKVAPNIHFGNLPLEILNHLTVYIHTIIAASQFRANIYQTQACESIAPSEQKRRDQPEVPLVNAVMTLNDIQANTDRILNTPLPLAYAIAISQLTWVYILILPFQLYTTLGMLSIPGTLFAAYMILGFASIGREIENPFGHDVNDLPLDDFCNQLAVDIDIIAATAPKDAEIFVKSDRNQLMHPLSRSGYGQWEESSIEEIRDALKRKSLRTQKNVQPGLRRRNEWGKEEV